MKLNINSNSSRSLNKKHFIPYINNNNSNLFENKTGKIYYCRNNAFNEYELWKTHYSSNDRRINKKYINSNINSNSIIRVNNIKEKHYIKRPVHSASLIKKLKVNNYNYNYNYNNYYHNSNKNKYNNNYYNKNYYNYYDYNYYNYNYKRGKRPYNNYYYKEVEVERTNERDEKFKEDLKNIGYYIKEVEGDGNCLFRSVAEQIEENENNFQEYREKCVEYMKENKDTFAPFLDEGQPIDEYIEKISKSGEWGGNLEIYALSMALHVNFYIYIFEQPVYVVKIGMTQKKI